MAYGSHVTEYLCKGLVFFNAIVIQARLTSRFTPAFSRNLEEKLPGHKRVLFSWMGLSDFQLNVFMTSVSAALALLLWVPSLRAAGLWSGVGLSIIALYSDLQLNESFVPHTSLLILSCVGLWFME